MCTKDPYGHIFVYTCAYKFNKYIPVNIRLLEYVFVSYLQGIGFIETISGHSVMVNVKDFDTHAHTHTNTHMHTHTHIYTPSELMIVASALYSIINSIFKIFTWKLVCMSIFVIQKDIFKKNWKMTQSCRNQKMA